MPLVATVNGQRVVATLLNDDQWERLRADVRQGDEVLTMRCGWPGHPKVSALGTRFFAHNRGGDSCSAGESANHLAGKAAVMSWVADKYPDLHVDAEVTLGDRERVADVMVTWPDGQRLAIEIQYAGLSVASWRERTEDYSRFGIRVLWLLGHTPPHMKADALATDEAPGGSDWPRRARMGPLHRHLARRGETVAWIDPHTKTVALPTQVALLTGLPPFVVPATGEHDTADLLVQDLRDFELDVEEGLTSSGSLQLASALSEFKAAKADRAAQQLADEVRRSAERARRRRQAADHAEWLRQRPPVPVPDGAPWTHCRNRTCRLPLDPILRNVGFHIGCGPQDRFGRRNEVRPAPDDQGSLF